MKISNSSVLYADRYQRKNILGVGYFTEVCFTCCIIQSVVNFSLATALRLTCNVWFGRFSHCHRSFFTWQVVQILLFV